MEKGDMNTNETVDFFSGPKMIYIKVFNLINVHNISSVYFLTYRLLIRLEKKKHIKTHQSICKHEQEMQSSISSY